MQLTTKKIQSFYSLCIECLRLKTYHFKFVTFKKNACYLIKLILFRSQ